MSEKYKCPVCGFSLIGIWTHDYVLYFCPGYKCTYTLFLDREFQMSLFEGDDM